MPSNFKKEKEERKEGERKQGGKKTETKEEGMRKVGEGARKPKRTAGKLVLFECRVSGTVHRGAEGLVAGSGGIWSHCIQ